MRPRSDSKLLTQLEKQVSALKDEIQRHHNELLQVRNALRSERLKTHDLEMALQEKDMAFKQQQADYDRDLTELISKLVILESDFRKEQKEIIEVLQAANAKLEWQTKILHINDKKIESQKKELDALKSSNKLLLDSLSEIRHKSNSTPDLNSTNASGDIDSKLVMNDIPRVVRTSSSSSLSPTSRVSPKIPRSPKSPRGPKSTRSPKSPRRSRKSSDGSKLPRAASPWREELTSFF